MADTYRSAVTEARKQWLMTERRTMAEIDQIYAAAQRRVLTELARRLPTQPSATHLRGLLPALAEARRELAGESAVTTVVGMEASARWGTSIARTAARAFSPALAPAVLDVAYQRIARDAVAAFALRSRDGMRLSVRVWRHARDWEAVMKRSVGAALASGASARELAEEIDALVNPRTRTPQRDRARRRLGLPRRVSYQAMRLARTEIADAHREGTIRAYRDTPGYTGLRWELSGSHPIRDLCDDYAEGGDNGDGFYRVGTEPMAPHPMCLCYLVPAFAPASELAQRGRAWANGARDPGLDRLERYANTASSALAASGLGVYVRRAAEAATLEDARRLAAEAERDTL